jgi:hypothetical protein
MAAFRAVRFGISACALLAGAGLLLTPTPAPASLVMSTFDMDRDGWATTFGAANGTGSMWQSMGGNPGGYVGSPDTGAQSGWSFAQDGGTFAGNRSAAYGGVINYDLISQGAIATRFSAEDVRLSGGGLTLVIDAGVLPTTSWETYSVSLLASAGWRVNTLGGLAATEAQMMTVLGSLTGIRIRGDYMTDFDTTGLDNVALVAVPEPAAVWMLGTAGMLGLLVRCRRSSARQLP